ncbi:MAG: hypothetical protein AAF513_02635 [Pseudomonadota bacterium]
MNHKTETPDTSAARREQRAHLRPQAGVDYRVRVIPGSGGQLELVEQEPKRSTFLEWSRMMHYSGWGF